jgi:thiamine transport system substrate-binding protein
MRIIIGAVASVLALSACGQADVSGSTVRLLTHDSFALSEAVIAQFESDTGISLEIIPAGDAGTITAGAILAAGAPTADVLFGVDNALVHRATAEGVFEEYTSPELAQVIPSLRGDTSGGLVTPIDFGDVCVNVDTQWFAERSLTPPMSIDELTDPRYADLLVVQDPATSSPGLAFLMATVSRYGENWPGYWENLRSNGVKVAGSWTDAYYSDFSVSGGDRPLVVSYASSPPAELVFAEPPAPDTPRSAVITDGCFRQVEYAGILRGTPNKAGAEMVIDWLLSEPVQADIPLTMFVFPAREGTTLPEVFTSFAGEVAEPETLPTDYLAENATQIVETWSTTMGR